MKNIFTFLIFASLGFQTFAQWTHSGPEYYHHISKPFLIHGNELWTKSNSTILRSLDNGSNWSTICNIPIIINDLIVTNNYAIAISNQGIYKSSNNYTNWFSTSSIVSNIIRKTNSGRIILGSGPYYSDDNGITWLQSNVTQSLELRDIVEYNGVLIAAGQNGVYISIDNGINWTQSNQGISALDLAQTIWNICVFDNKVFISTGSSSGYYKSSDLGQTWSQAYTGLPSNSIINPNIVVLNNQLLTTNSNGIYIYNLITNDWQLSTLNQSPLVGINNYFDNKYWGLKMDYDGFVKTSDNGLNWQNSYSGIKQADCKKLSISKGKLYSIGNYGSFVLDTVNSSWSRFTVKGFNFKGTLGNDSRIYDIKKGSGTTTYLASEGGVWTSSNNGSTWTQHLTGLPQQSVPTASCKVNSLYIFGTGGNDTIIAATAAGIYYSTNQAQSFTQATGANNGNFNDIIFTQGKLYAAGNGIYSSTNRGLTWAVVNNISSGNITQIAATNTKLWVITNQNAGFTNIGPDSGLHGMIDGTIAYAAQFLTAYDSLLFINHPGVTKINENFINSSGSNAGDIDVDISQNLPKRPFVNVFGDTINYYSDYMGAGDMEIFNGKLWVGTQRLSTFYRSMNDFGYNFIVTDNNRINELNKIQLYPNPADNSIYFTNLPNNCIIYIYNNIGQLQKSFTTNYSGSFDIGNLSKGFYTYSIIDNKQNIISNGKFIKQ